MSDDQNPGRVHGRLLDWRHASVGDPAPCVRCRRPALMRNPDTGRPEHKVCAEAALAPN
ncbi:hypothetical protein [Streptomyces sp.]|uniref:hypothetical protein n=1 Tax=Streptomyces sp. TaxID=1931 RepID=UPI002F935DF8